MSLNKLHNHDENFLVTFQAAAEAGYQKFHFCSTLPLNLAGCDLLGGNGKTQKLSCELPDQTA